MFVGAGGVDVLVGGTGVFVGGTGVFVGGSGVFVGGTGVFVGGSVVGGFCAVSTVGKVVASGLGVATSSACTASWVILTKPAVAIRAIVITVAIDMITLVIFGTSCQQVPRVSGGNCL